jgi:DNA polymerase-3 subunit delta'
MNALDELLLHDQTLKSVNLFLSKPSHALLILGPVGSGKKFLARNLAAQILKINGKKLESHPFFILIQKTKKEIGIDSVRSVVKKLNLKTTGKGEIKRVVLIEDAETMSHEAQNSLLKVLEEVNIDTVFILTAPHEKNLLPTISSRTQKILVRPINLEDSLAYYDKTLSTRDIQSAWQLSQGGAGLMAALLSDDQSHPLRKAVDEAKAYLKSDKYTRFLQLEKISRDKDSFIVFLNALNRIITALNDSAIKAKNEGQTRRLLKSRRLLYQLIDSLNQNASPKLVCLKLATDLAV